MDRILLLGLGFDGRHGVHPAEQELGGRFLVDLELSLDLRAAGASNDIADTVNYSLVHEIAKRIVEGPAKQLLEAVAEEIAAALLALPRVVSVVVRVAKRPALKGEFRTIAVEIAR